MRTVASSMLVLVGMAAAARAGAQAQLPGYGHAASAMGGASIAVPYDAIASANNPAAMAFVGSRADLALTPIFTKASSDLGPFRFDASDVGYAPTGGFNRDLGNGWTAGVSLYGFGSGIDYGRPFPGSTTNTRSNVAQLIVAPTATYRVAPQHAIGLAPLLAAQRIEIGGVQYVGFQDPGADRSYGVGAGVGYLGRFDGGWSVGVSYASRISMGRLDKYRLLLADSGKLDIPQQAGAGIAWQATPSWLVAADVLWIGWSSVKPLGNPFPGSGPPGSAQGPGFGWKDQTVVRLGVAWDVSEALTLRAGAARRSRLFDPESTALNTLAPLVPQVSLTAGATWHLDKTHSLSFAYARNLRRSIAGEQASSGIALTSSAQFVTLGYGYRF